MANVWVSYLSWMFVPALVTGFVQRFYYRTQPNVQPPPTGSPSWVKHNTRIQITFIALYFLYSIYAEYHSLLATNDLYAQDFYRVLGVTHADGDRGIKSRFRKLAALHHPDKVGASGTEGSSEMYFLHLKIAQDTLLDPARRYAYDHFGRDMLHWQNCTTISDYLKTASKQYTAQYLGSVGIIFVLDLLGFVSDGKFWRLVATIIMATLELYTATHASPSYLEKYINPVLARVALQPLLPFQVLALFRQAMIAVTAFTRFGSYFAGPMSPLSPNVLDEPRLAHLEAYARVTDVIGGRAFETNMQPFKAGSMGEVRASTKEWLTQNIVREHAPVKEAIELAKGSLERD